MNGGQTTIPRWEWRAFGDRFGVAEEYLSALTPTAVQDSDETYLLAPDSETVKVRFEQMDIKVLREVDTFGLERWEPILKADVPLTEDEITVVFEAMRHQVPPLAREEYTFAQFLEELIEPYDLIRQVPIRKHRVRYTIHGCTGECTDVVADGREARTIAIEDGDPDAVRAAVRAIGLGGFVNTSYPRGLTQLLSGAPTRYATIDVGTNSVKFHVAEQTSDGGWRTVVDRTEVSQLGEGLADSGAIGTEPLARTSAAIAAMVAEARDNHVRAIAAVGTAGLRMASNQADAVGKIEAETGVTVEVISGEDESRLAYLAVLDGLGTPDGAVVVFDTGGGSSQFTFGVGAEVDERFSVDVGAVRFTERFSLDGVVAADELESALEAIASDLSRLDDREPPAELVGMGGAITNMTAVMLALDPYDADAVQGAVLTRTEVDRQIALYASQDVDGRRGIVGLQPKRAGVILAGACVVRTVMDKLSQDSLTVSDRGLRHGLIVERFEPLRA